MAELDVVGKSHTQIDAVDKARGRTKFVSDLTLPNMLYGRVLRSPFAHARIRSIDTSRAERMPGVKAVVTYADTPGVQFGPRTEDWTILAKDKVRFCGDEVAAVAAIDENTAEEALDLIRVEYEELPFVVDPIEARLVMLMQPSGTLFTSMKIGFTRIRCIKLTLSRWELLLMLIPLAGSLSGSALRSQV
jgi:CO/xanthine dehydrogenase Mo-binding subunit